MIILDRTYGKFEVREPVILELLESPELLRLKNVSQGGMPERFFTKTYSRYEHSVGVMLLLKKLGASLEEQVAGLLHDVSTLSFSHVSDWVFHEGSTGKEEYHNLNHKSFIEKTQLKKLLKKYGFEPEKVLEDKNYSLLERDVPDLCADRIDYGLKDAEYCLSQNDHKLIADSLINYNGEILFNNVEAAKVYANKMLRLQTEWYGGYSAMARYKFLAEALKLAMQKSIITPDDFLTSEEEIITKLESSKDKKIASILKELLKKDLSDSKLKTGEKAFKKFRFVDPKVFVGDALNRLSDLCSDFKLELEKHRVINQQGILL